MIRACRIFSLLRSDERLRRTLRTLAGAAALLLNASPGRALEPWADPNLPIQDGLEIWLDASRPGGRLLEASKTTAEVLECWSDASGKGRDLVQSQALFRPTLRPASGASGVARFVVHFDGQDDWLERTREDLRLEAATVFLVFAPLSNEGMFRGLISTNAPGQNDYVSGVNVDLGPGAGATFNTVNIEGAGFGGATNLLAKDYPFGSFHLLCATFGGAPGVALFCDGSPHSTRSKTAGTMNATEIRLGARYYRNSPGPKTAMGFLHGDVAEALIYSRALSDDERARVEKYLFARHSPLLHQKPAPPEPALRMLAPGFEVRELPIQLANINDMAYDDAGRLFALGYDGRIHVLTDSDGDGLEDKAAPYWTKPTIRTPIAMLLAKEGVYVSSNQKISLLTDSDGDGEADKETVVVSGWEQSMNASGGVDALGMAIDGRNNLFFGLGCSDFTNAYLIKDGRSHYNLRSERGTILKVSPDRKRREIVCTGIRFPVAMAFNRFGDLFATDQEGETWLPGGNPTDELDHILPGRHYGFPPRHPTHLPHVVDEPPSADYTPQHQSACGLAFNEASASRPAFGPKLWEGDALVAGYSRGKIWRTKLVKTSSGYVSRTDVVATSRMLLVDVAVSPKGNLVVACHSGSPDWGAGPQGPGKLFQIRYGAGESKRGLPQVAAVWPASPTSVRVAFDAPLDASTTVRIADQRAPFGEHIRAGDRYEVLRPGYQSVQDQLRSPTGNLRIVEATLAEDRRSVLLTTDPHPARAQYALPIVFTAIANEPAVVDRLETSYTLHGVHLRWTSDRTGESWAGWSPHVSPAVAQAFTAASGEHQRLSASIQSPGRLEIHGKLLLPAGESTLTIIAAGEPSVQIDKAPASPATGAGPQRRVAAVVHSIGEPIPFRIQLHKSAGACDLDAIVRLPNDPHERPLKLEQLLVPWAPGPMPKAPPRSAADLGEFAGGDWKSGEAVFFSKEANCSACHWLKGKGGRIGPDLSNLTSRDPASVYRDVTEPSAAVNPDFAASTLLLKDGRVLHGVVRTESAAKLKLLDSEAREAVFALDEVEQLQASSTSIMPKGMLDRLGREKVRDLVVFLTQPPPPEEPKILQPKRTPKEVEALHHSLPIARTPDRPLNVVLVAGKKDHGPGEHEYPRWQQRWKALLSTAPNVRVSTAFGFPDRAQWELADVVVFYFWIDDWSKERLEAMDEYLKRGGGIVAIHSAVIDARNPNALAQRTGLASKPGRTKFRHGPLKLSPTGLRHPITAGLKSFEFFDESYWPPIGELNRVQVLATAVEEGKTWPMLWTYEPGKGRVFCSILGHYYSTFDDPIFRTLLLRGIAWAAREPESRLQPLAVPGDRTGN